MVPAVLLVGSMTILASAPPTWVTLPGVYVSLGSSDAEASSHHSTYTPPGGRLSRIGLHSSVLVPPGCGTAWQFGLCSRSVLRATIRYWGSPSGGQMNPAKRAFHS